MTRAAGEGTLYQDDRGRWIGMASAGINPKSGKRRRVKITGAAGETKEQVARRLADRIAELETQSPAAPQTVGELVKSWRRRAAPKKMSSRTLAMVDSLIANHIDPVLGGVKVGALTAEDVEDFLDARADDYARSTLTKLRSILAQAYDFGIKRRHISWNPARVAELPPESETREPKTGRALTADETALLLKAAEDDRLGAWVVVALTLGLRPEASTREVRSAYRRLAFATHPDRSPEDPGAPDKFRRVQSAYEAITSGIAPESGPLIEFVVDLVGGGP